MEEFKKLSRKNPRLSSLFVHMPDLDPLYSSFALCNDIGAIRLRITQNAQAWAYGERKKGERERSGAIVRIVTYYVDPALWDMAYDARTSDFSTTARRYLLHVNYTRLCPWKPAMLIYSERHCQIYTFYRAGRFKHDELYTSFVRISYIYTQRGYNRFWLMNNLFRGVRRCAVW